MGMMHVHHHLERDRVVYTPFKSTYTKEVEVII